MAPENDAPRPLKPLVLLEDEPVSGHEQDELGLYPFSATVAGAAVGTRGPFTIGVFGDWGFGKTSILRQAKSLIDSSSHDRPAVTVWFNAWQFEKEEHLIVPLIATIVREVERAMPAWEKAKEKAVEAGRGLVRALRAIAYGFSAKGKMGVPGFGELEAGFVAKEMIERYEKLKERADPLLDRSLYYNAFEVLENLPKDKAFSGVAPKIVVFVDDLDRCLPDRALALIEGIKLVLAQPGFVFVLAVDRSVIEGYLRKRYEEEFGVKDPDKGARYLDKIVQLPFPLPSHEGRFEKYLGDLIASRTALAQVPEVQDILRELSGVLAIGSHYNPRNLVRFINNLLVDRHIYGLLDPRKREAMAKDEQDFLRTIAVARALRMHLSAADYDRLVRDNAFCEALAAGRGKPLHERLESFEAEKRYPHRQVIAAALREHDFLLTLLDSDIGRAWLTEYERRMKVDQFLIEQRPEKQSAPPPKSAADVIDRHIRMHLGKAPGEPISDEERRKVCELSLLGEGITDPGLEHLKPLIGLHDLSLQGADVSDSGMVCLENLTHLRRLNLTNTRVTDSGIAHLKELTALEALFLEATEVTDAGLTVLKDLKELRVLDLDNTRVGDAGIEHLKNLTGLVSLYLGGTRVTDAGLEHLRELRGLKALGVSRTDVTDSGLPHLEGLKELSWLGLQGQRGITDSSVELLVKLKELGVLWLEGTSITPAGRARLEAALPKCNIYYGERSDA